MMKVVIHIGFPKAGSSSLQKGLSQCADLTFLGLYPTNNIAEVGGNVSKSEKQIPYLSDPRIAAFYRAFARADYSHEEQVQLYGEICVDYNDGCRVLFFSCEAFTSPMFSEVSPATKLKRLYACCSDAKFILIARNQADIIKSQYRDWPFDLTVENGRPLNLEEWVVNELQREDEMGPLKWFDLLKITQPIFDAGKPGTLEILLFEDFVSSRSTFCRELAEVLRINQVELERCLDQRPANQGISKYYNLYRKLRRLILGSVPVGRLVPRRVRTCLLRLLNSGKPEKLIFSSELESLLSSEFARGNHVVADRYNLDLKARGYWI